MYSPTLRLLTVLELLQARDSITGAELARRLEVDGRSVRRYIAKLQDLGVPVESARGRYGSHRLRPGYKLPPLMFTDEEAIAVTLGLLAIQTQGFTFAAPSIAGATTKVTRVLPIALRERIEALKQVVILDARTRPTMLTVDGEVILRMAEAVYTRHRVVVRYRTEDGERTGRTVDPYGVAFWSGRWNMVGYCHLREAIRAFRLARVRGVTPHAQSYEPPVGFDCADYLAHSFGRFVHRWDVEVVLKTSLEEARAKIPPTHGTVEAAPSGVVYRCRADNMADTARFLVDLRVPFAVVKPDELRLALRELAAEINCYADAPPQTP